MQRRLRVVVVVVTGQGTVISETDPEMVIAVRGSVGDPVSVSESTFSHHNPSSVTRAIFSHMYDSR